MNDAHSAVIILGLMPLFSPLLLAAALPDLAAVDKLFAEKRYAEALKGASRDFYTVCLRCFVRLPWSSLWQASRYPFSPIVLFA